MCEECESDQSLTQSYAHKRARMRAYWTPKRKSAGFNAADEFGDLVLRSDLLQHLQHGFIGAAMQRAIECSRGSGGGNVRIGL